MNRRTLAKVVSLSFALIVGLVAMKQGHAQDAKTPYSTMAPLEQYLMADRNAEIALARIPAPDSISSDATVLVLGRHGYEIAVYKRWCGRRDGNPHGLFKPAREKCVERNLSAIITVEPSLNTPLRVFVPELCSVRWVLRLFCY